MMLVGTVESLWRYPIKSMAGEALDKAFFGYGGVYGDRMYGFVKSPTPAAPPFLTGRDCREMVLYRPRFRNPGLVTMPTNQSEADQFKPRLTIHDPGMSPLMADVATPSGEMLAVDNPMHLAKLMRHLSKRRLSIVRSDRAMTDSYPVSLISLQTINQLSEELNAALDKRRFRANIYARLTGAPFAEDSFVGKRLQIGSRVVVAAIIRDKRCKMITIDPATAKETFRIMRNVARLHEGDAGIYCDVITEGMVQVGDPITLLN